ncbi:MAG: class I SAM-dependent methyltransferase [Acidimicrobiia bacterium]|nr:class I SAM-dependent methyltransferase [Acidimicrobiia bacterium]
MSDDAPPAGLFESFYREAGGDASAIPWAAEAPNHFVTTWLQERSGRRGEALVVACGLGDDAEALAADGWKVTAFDIAPSAIGWCRERFPATDVDYQVHDLFDLPPQWSARFDLVVEVLTIQSLPPDVRDEVIHRIAALVAPAGHLLAVSIGRRGQQREHGPPWPLAKDELDEFSAAGLSEIGFTSRPSSWEGFDLFNVEYVRPAE